MSERTELLARLERLQPVLARRFSGEAHRQPPGFEGVTLHQLMALRHIVDEGPLTMNELAARVGSGPSSATQLADRLVAHGLVERVPDPKDRRVQRLRVTKSAADTVAQFKSRRREVMAELIAPLTDSELETFVRIAEKMAAGVEPADV